MFKSILTILLLLSSTIAFYDPRLTPLGPGNPYPEIVVGGKLNRPLPIGFDDQSGLLWAVMCINTPHGKIPGKLDKDNNASYVWGGRIFKCLESREIDGTFSSNQDPIPFDCENRGYQYDSDDTIYSVVVRTKHGLIPGKGLRSSNTAWYGYDGKEFSVNDNFYYVC